MPCGKGKKKMLHEFIQEYGEEGESIFYATLNKQKKRR
jgi:hypothetical protein